MTRAEMGEVRYGEWGEISKRRSQKKERKFDQSNKHAIKRQTVLGSESMVNSEISLQTVVLF